MREENHIFEAIKRNVLEVLPEIDPDLIAMTSSLSDLGCNSIDRVEVIAMTMRELGIVVPVQEFKRGDEIAKFITVMRRYV